MQKRVHLRKCLLAASHKPGHVFAWSCWVKSLRGLLPLGWRRTLKRCVAKPSYCATSSGTSAGNCQDFRLLTFLSTLAPMLSQKHQASLWQRPCCRAEGWGGERAEKQDLHCWSPIAALRRFSMQIWVSAFQEPEDCRDNSSSAFSLSAVQSRYEHASYWDMLPVIKLLHY